MKWLKQKQSGVASLLVTMILIALMSAVAVTFAVVMNRELHKSVNNQLAQAAYDASESGISDAISYLKTNPNVDANDCQDLLGPGKPLAAAANLSPDGSTKYTCVLINTKPLDLAYQSIAADKSQVFRTNTSGVMGKMMISWQSSDRTHNQFVPSGQSGQLLDETTWNNSNFAPLMRVSIYPIPADSQSLASINSDARTYFLYPVAASNFNVDHLSYAKASGSLVPVECGITNTNGTFNGSADDDCNVIIDNLPTTDSSGYTYYIRLTPLYQQADSKIKGNDASGTSQPVHFIGTQGVIDVTAQSANVVKRLQARVDISSLNGGNDQNIYSTDNNLPEQALRSAFAICKRYINPQDPTNLPVYIDPNSINSCGAEVQSLKQLDKPVVTPGSGSADSSTSASFSGTVNPNNGKLSSCYFDVNGTHYDCLSQVNTTDYTKWSQNYSVNASASGLSSGGQVSWQLCATNPAGQNCQSGTTFNLPQPSGGGGGGGSCTSGLTVSGGWSATVNCSGLWDCQFDYPGGTATYAPHDSSNNSPYGNQNFTQPSGTTHISCLGTDGSSGSWSSGGGNPTCTTNPTMSGCPCPSGYSGTEPYCIINPVYPPPPSCPGLGGQCIWAYDHYRNPQPGNSTIGKCSDSDSSHQYFVCIAWQTNANNNGNTSDVCTFVQSPQSGNSGNGANTGTTGFGSISTTYLNGTYSITCTNTTGIYSTAAKFTVDVFFSPSYPPA